MSSTHEFDEKDEATSPAENIESGYVSGDSEASLNEVFFSKAHLKYINQQLKNLPPQAILQWSIITLPFLYQITAFGQSGLVTLDMLSKMSGPIKPDVPLVFIDTLHHFPETLALVDGVRERYPHATLHVYKPDGCDTEQDFAAKFGERFWETDEDAYDYNAKVEPQQRANIELRIKAVLTGRRRSQGGKRSELDIVEVTDEGIIKVNPLANWSYQQVIDYIRENNVPYNELRDLGYKSIGDWHSTQPTSEDEDERAGRWKGRQKSECGIHNPKSRYAQFLRQQAMKEQAEQLSDSLSSLTVSAS